jgi:hypothetical protein
MIEVNLSLLVNMVGLLLSEIVKKGCVRDREGPLRRQWDFVMIRRAPTHGPRNLFDGQKRMGKGVEMVILSLSKGFQASQLREEDDEKAGFIKCPHPLVSMRSEEDVIHFHFETSPREHPA